MCDVTHIQCCYDNWILRQVVRYLSVGTAFQFKISAFCVRTARATLGGRTNQTSEVSHASKSSPNSRTKKKVGQEKSRLHHTRFSLSFRLVSSTTVCSRTSLLRHHQEKSVQFPWTTRRARRHPERLVCRSFYPVAIRRRSAVACDAVTTPHTSAPPAT